MTRTYRYDVDRQATITRVSALTGWLGLADHTISHLRALIDLDHDDGLRAASYDGRVRGGTPTTHAERHAISGRGDKAAEDLGAIDYALGLLAEGERILFEVVDRRDPMLKRKPGDANPDKRTVGKGTAPAHLCQVCWVHKKETEREGNYALWCDACGRFHRTHGKRPLSRPVWEEIQRRGYATTPILRKYMPELVPAS